MDESTKTWRILLLDTKRSNPNHYICLAIERALAQRADVESVTRADYVSAISAARDRRCNLFLAFDGEELDRDIAARLARVCGTSILWVTEDPYELQFNLDNADLFDLVFSNDSGSVAAYGAKGRHLALAADPGMHYRALPAPGDDDHYLYDLFFAGTAWPNRVEFIKQLQAGVQDIRLKLALPGNPHIPEPDLDLAPSSYQWRTPSSEFARFANRSRAVLTLHRSFSSSGNAPTAHTPGPRLFEVALAGGLQFIDLSVPQIDVSPYFEEGTEFVGFRSVEECIDKLRHYLADPGACATIAAAAQRRAQKDHLYANRLDVLFAELQALPEKSPAVSGRAQQRPKVLFVSHNIAGVQPYGGVEIYQDLIKASLADDFEFLFYVPDRAVSPLGQRCILYNEHMHAVEEHVFDGPISDALLSCPQRERTFSGILLRHGIEIVHFQHLIGHTPSLAYLPKALGIASIISLHDYYAICRHFNLIGYKGGYCNIAALPKVTCDICLNAADNMAAGSQARRRAFFGRALEQIDILHANTAGVAELFKAIYPTLFSGERLRVLGVPMPFNGHGALSAKRQRQPSPLRIAILGNFTKNKGAEEIIHAVNQLRHDDVEFTIFGAVAAPYSEIIRALDFPNVTVHGSYTAGTLADKLRDFSVSMHLSIWPETYCITLSEAWHQGLVPIVSDIGALGERVTHGVNGFKVPPGESGPLVDTIRTMISDPGGVEAVRTRITPDLFIDVCEHMQELTQIYSDLLSKVAVATELGSPSRGRNRGFALEDYGVVLNHRTWVRTLQGPHVSQVAEGPLAVSKGPQSVLQRTLGYTRRHGPLATVRRALREIFRPHAVGQDEAQP